MKNFYKYLISGLCLSFASLSAFAVHESISLGISIQEDNEEEDLPSKGFRIPSSHKECTIDFQNHRIGLSTSEIILTFELWDEDGITLMASFASDHGFVDFLSGLSGGYQLRLIGEDHVYIGYLEL